MAVFLDCTPAGLSFIVVPYVNILYYGSADDLYSLAIRIAELRYAILILLP